MAVRGFIGLLCGLALASATLGEPPATGALPLPPASGTSAPALAAALRGVLVQMLPAPLFQAEFGWGKTKRAPTGLKWTGKGLDVHAKLQHAQRNDGTWRKVLVTADRPGDTLVLDLRNLQSTDPGRMTFNAFITFGARVNYEKQQWHKGLRLYSTSVRARLRVQLQLNCEVTARLEPHSDSLVPDAVFRLRVVRAQAGYKDLVVEHVAGVGGDAAKLLGEIVQQSIHRFDPRLEKKLLARANAAIEKAGDTREVRLSLSTLWKH